MQILNKLGALRKKKTPRIINGTEFQFYPVRVARILTGDLKDILEPVSEAVQVLLLPRNADQEVISESDPTGVVAQQIKPPSPEMVRYRSEQKKTSIKAAMDALFADSTRFKIIRIIMDSLRDDCPADPTEEEVKQFADHESMDINTFIEFVKGFLAANTAIFGELGNLVRERINKAMEKMNPADQDQESNAPDQPQPEETEAATETLHDEAGEVPTT